MAKKLQNFIRNAYSDHPLHCPLCGHLLLSSDDAEFSREYSKSHPSPCEHTLYVAHSEGYEYLSDRVREQLSKKNYNLGNDEFFVTISDSEGEEINPYELPELLEFDDGLNVESVVGAPSNMAVYVGIAPLDE